MTTKTPTPQELDIRVRSRNLKSGVITEKDVEKHLAGLPDMEPNAESFSLPQPAFEEPEEIDDMTGDEADSPSISS
jgi:hypothetical protein